MQVYCLMETNNCGNVTGGWTRAVYINMTNVNNSCPQGLTTSVINSTRVCSSHLGGGGCTSVHFPTHSVHYSKVCGRALGYQYGNPDAFRDETIDSSYVNGVSITHGAVRDHIWTFAAGFSKDSNHGGQLCPCAAQHQGRPPSLFVGEDYFCESGASGPSEHSQWYLDDPLWDSQGCASGSTCCDRGGPWFSTTLSGEVNDDIEVRWCTGYANEEGTVEEMEIYIS